MFSIFSCATESLVVFIYKCNLPNGGRQLVTNRNTGVEVFLGSKVGESFKTKQALNPINTSTPVYFTYQLGKLTKNE